MTIDGASDLARHAILIGLLVGSPVILISLAVGFAVSLFQALTQIQDQTLSVIPKLVAMLLAIIWLMPWTLETMSTYTTELYLGIPDRI